MQMFVDKFILVYMYGRMSDGGVVAEGEGRRSRLFRLTFYGAYVLYC